MILDDDDDDDDDLFFFGGGGGWRMAGPILMHSIRWSNNVG